MQDVDLRNFHRDQRGYAEAYLNDAKFHLRHWQNRQEMSVKLPSNYSPLLRERIKAKIAHYELRVKAFEYFMEDVIAERDTIHPDHIGTVRKYGSERQRRDLPAWSEQFTPGQGIAIP